MLTHVPKATFKVRKSDEPIPDAGVCDLRAFEWKDIASDEIFKGKKIVVIALPGAYTPICTSQHLPGYEENFEKFKELGVDKIYCLCVNDAFVMDNWSKDLGLKNVKMLPDGNGEFTRKLGMLVKKENLGYGDRTWRYSMYVEDGEIKKAFVEPRLADNAEEDPFEVSDADTMLGYLKGLK